MKIKQISLGVFILACMVALPQESLAYFTTAQSAIKINDTTAIFAIEYAFGLEDQDIYMPVLAERGLKWKSEEKKLGYVLSTNDEITKSGSTTGMVVANLPIENGMYKIAKGTAKKMTFYIILTTPKDALKTRYQLQVEQLPYYVDQGKKDLETRQLNPSELQYYVTKGVTLNKATAK